MLPSNVRIRHKDTSFPSNNPIKTAGSVTGILVLFSNLIGSLFKLLIHVRLHHVPTCTFLNCCVLDRFHHIIHWETCIHFRSVLLFGISIIFVCSLWCPLVKEEKIWHKQLCHSIISYYNLNAKLSYFSQCKTFDKCSPDSAGWFICALLLSAAMTLHCIHCLWTNKHAQKVF